VLYIFIVILLVGLIMGPSWWVKRIIRQFAVPRADIPGTGGQLARHLLDKFSLEHVKLELTQQGDHYDAQNKCVRLAEAHLNGKSLAAIVIAAHEVGHALQDASGYAPLRWRTTLALWADAAEKFGAVFMFAIPVVTAFSRAPVAGLATYAVAALLMSVSVLVHLVTLPVEINASFKRALPLLESGRYVSAEDLPKAKKLLTAAAMTYVSQSLSSLLNMWRWLRLLRR
jgi:Zn-dependent membrane protease YugP